ncbi:DUF916 and DUF3324 domain-containing protein [Enterococcus gilvus]|uniref:DUF916 and DUF3324 domain-containing protein n=1 Tax=Enterococcus gilvus TaxID=160453 RepID=UPI001C8C7DF9|nr:DUF916 and DUF3324 domain-containing protein [Enterococcus gilvus]MBX8935320.1 DUF916 and DUF3324 domain-containing protein [Enterococcus gilvus]
MKRKKRSTLLRTIIILGIGMILCFPVVSVADQKDSSGSANEASKKASELAGKTGFTVESVQSENQINKDFSFFYVHTQPSEEQTLKVKVISKRKEPSKVKIHVNNAVTNIMGQIDYGQKNVQLDSSMKQPITDFVSLGAKEVTVKNFEEKIVELHVKPPKDSYQGVRLGAVVFRSADSQEKEETGVNNTYGYKIAIMTSEDLRPYNEGGRINYISVKASLQNGQKAIAMKVQNPEPAVLENVSIRTKIFPKGEKEPLATNALAGMKLAPNSSFDYLTYLGLEDLKAGKYVIQASATDGKETWEWEKEFTISDKQANQINEDAAYKITMPKLYKGFGISLIILTLGNIGYLVYRKRKTSETKKGGGKDDASEG